MRKTGFASVKREQEVAYTIKSTNRTGGEVEDHFVLCRICILYFFRTWIVAASIVFIFLLVLYMANLSAWVEQWGSVEATIATAIADKVIDTNTQSTAGISAFPDSCTGSCVSPT